MTTNDDWRRFVAMMEAAGWCHLMPVNVFTFSDPVAFPMYSPEGTYSINGKVSNIGYWRQWLEAGQSPPPF